MKNLILLFLALGMALFALSVWTNSEQEVKEDVFVGKPQETALLNFDLKTDTSKRSIDVGSVFSGGPGKDGIPALSDPKFVEIEDADVGDEVLGVLMDINGEKRFYPYNIIVWHEIVNDSINGVDFAVTFCPLCGSAIVFDRNVGEDTLSFGVSGLLYESNLLMYDKQTESLWSQAKNEAVVGHYTGEKLSILPMKLIEFETLKKRHPDAVVLSRDTGYERNYNVEPYSGYGLSEDLYFPVSVSDARFFAKQIMYVIPNENESIAFPEKELQSTTTLKRDGAIFVASRAIDGIVVTKDGENTPGYYEMWFSWATHHQEDGFVWEI